MLKLYLNTVTRTWYDADGNLLADEQPQIPFGNTETVIIQCCSATEYFNAEDGEIALPIDQWVHDTQFAGLNIGALLTTDNNFIHRKKGKLFEPVVAGNVDIVTAEINGATIGTIPASGSVRIFNDSGESESIEYIKRTVADGVVIFICAEGSAITQGYNRNSMVDCPETLYAQAAMNNELSAPDTGLFAFDFLMDSPKLREKVDYGNMRNIEDIKGLELLIFSSDPEKNTIQVKNTYTCDTFYVPVPMAEANPNPQIPDTQRDNIVAITSSLISEGLDTEVRDNNGIIEMRIKLTSTGADSWSEWAAVGRNLQIQYSADNSSWHDTAVDGDKYIRTSVDGGVTWSAGLLFKGADGKDGEPGVPGEDGTPAGFGTPAANVTTLETGSNATVSVTASGEDTAKVFTFAFGIPKGERGDSFTPDAIGDTAEKANYDAEPKGFAFLDSTESKLYFKLSDDSGDWSDGTPFGKGDKGDAGEPAGFGVPTATVNTLDADSSATVSVTATGENTSKVFSFVFGIPKGKDGAKGDKGDTPVKGIDFYTEADKEELLDELEDRLLNGEWGTE